MPALADGRIVTEHVQVQSDCVHVYATVHARVRVRRVGAVCKGGLHMEHGSIPIILTRWCLPAWSKTTAASSSIFFSHHNLDVSLTTPALSATI